jgi:hypothetical protein
MQHQKKYIATITGILLFLMMSLTAQPNSSAKQHKGTISA